jgi:enoyl-[acyl-carrier protein] reductase II
MDPDLLRLHIRRCRSATQKPFGVNIPLLYPEVSKQIQVVLEEKVSIVFTSAGNPATWTGVLKKEGVRVIHVVSSSLFAKKAEAAGCEAVVAEGFEAGGHNGREETTTLILVPSVCSAVRIPVIAAGGIATGRQMLAAMVLGAAGVQMGTRFVASEEASSHNNFKKRVIDAAEGDTMLSIKKVNPVRILRNSFFQRIREAEDNGASADELRLLLGKGRARKGMFEGDLEDGELEIGQVSSMVGEILPAGDIVRKVWAEFESALPAPLA